MKDKFWIDIKDKEPEYSGDYYICREPQPMIFDYEVDWYYADIKNKGFTYTDVVAWAEIPKYEHKPEDRYV